MRALRTGTALVLVATLAGGLTTLAIRLLAAAWSAVLLPGPATLDQLSTAAAGSALALACGWLGTVLAAGLVSAAAERTGHAGRLTRWCARITPVLVRRLVAATIGAGVLIGPAVPAMAAATSSSTAVRAVQVDELDPGWNPSSGPVRQVEPGPHRGSTSTLGAGLPVPTPATDRTAPPRAPVTAQPSTRQSRTGEPGTVQPSELPGARVRAPLAGEVVVRRGDTLWDLAARSIGPGASVAEIAAEWPRWYAVNRAAIGPDPDRLRPGQRLTAPSGAATPAGDRP